MSCDSVVLPRNADGEIMPYQKERSGSLFEISVPALLSYISVGRRAIEALGEQLELSADDLSALRLAVGEACNNAVQYGSLEQVFRDRPQEQETSRKLGIACRLVEGIIEIDVINEDSSFYPAPEGTRMPPPESLTESGRGLALIDLMMDSVEHLSIEGNHVVRMRKRFSPSASFHDEATNETRPEP